MCVCVDICELCSEFINVLPNSCVNLVIYEYLNIYSPFKY